MRSQNDVDLLENANDELKQESNSESDLSISEDELQHDKIKMKQKKKHKTKNQELQFATSEIDADENTSFYQMNLSRPLLKSISEMKFVHPTPIQASTIPIALLGKYYWNILLGVLIDIQECNNFTLKCCFAAYFFFLVFRT